MANEGKIVKLSRLFTYYMARKLQNRLRMNGAELKTTLDSMILYGISRDIYWPFHFNRVNKEPSINAINDAANFRISSFELVNHEKFKEYLHRNIPIILGLHTGKMFWKLNGELSRQIYKPINNVDNRNFRGHAVTVIGYDDDILGGSWIIANSLGLAWGDHGIGILPYECYIDIGESYAITKFTGIIPERKISEF